MDICILFLFLKIENELFFFFSDDVIMIIIHYSATYLYFLRAVILISSWSQAPLLIPDKL